MTRNPARSRIRVALAAAAVAVLATAAAHATRAYAQAPAAGGAASNNGVRAHWNGGGSCCKNHADSLPCPGRQTDCAIDPTALECRPA